MILHALLIGALVGVVVGSLGAGGGIVSVPILVNILGQNQTKGGTKTKRGGQRKKKEV